MKRILVTGAAKGIGRATVSRLLHEGYAVLAADIDEAGSKSFDVTAAMSSRSPAVT